MCSRKRKSTAFNYLELGHTRKIGKLSKASEAVRNFKQKEQALQSSVSRLPTKHSYRHRTMYKYINLKFVSYGFIKFWRTQIPYGFIEFWRTQIQH